MADVNIYTDVNLRDVTWVQGDTIIVRDYATLTIDSDPGKYFKKLWAYRGTIIVRNTSTTDGFVIECSDSTPFEQDAYGGDFRFEGQLISIGTTNGVSGQSVTTWDRSAWSSFTKEQPAVFFSGDEWGMYSKTGYGTFTGHTGTELRHYDCTTGQQPTLTFNHLVPPAGLDILVPNIIFTKTANGWAYPRMSNAKNFYCKGLHWYGGVNMTQSSNFTMIDSISGGQGFHETDGITVDNVIFVGSYTNYALKPENSMNITMNKVMFCETPFFLNLSNITMTDIFLGSSYNSTNSYFYISTCNNMTVTNITMMYTNFQPYNQSKDITVENIHFHYDISYNNFENMLNMYLCENVWIKNVTVNTGFSGDAGKRLIKFSTNAYRCKVTDSTIDATGTNSFYMALFENRAKECGVYNVTFLNGIEGYRAVKMNTSSESCFIVNCNVGYRRLEIGGLNPIIKNNISRYEWSPTLGVFGGSMISNINQDNQSELNLTIRASTANETCEINNCKMDTKSNVTHLLDIDSYVTVKMNKDNFIRQCGNFIDTTIYGSYTNELDFFYCLDKGSIWKPLSDLTSSEIIGEELSDFWVKVTRTTAAQGNDVQFNAMQLVASLDTGKIPYEPYFYWAEIKLLSLPAESMSARLEIGTNPVEYVTDISTEYLHNQLWRESAENVSVKIRRYGYSSYESKNVMNDTSLNFFYTGHEIFDLTMTLAEALTVQGVYLNYNVDYFEHDLYWNYTLDCGGNHLSDVYHYIQAICSQQDVYQGQIGLDWWYMLVRDGDKFKTLMSEDGNGVRVINYGGNLSSTQSNSGELYIPIQYGNLEFTRLQQYSEVRIFRKDTMEYLSGKESTLTSYIYPYNWSGDIDVVVSILHLKYNPVVLETTLKEASSILPINQIFNKNYNDPVAPILKTNTFSLKKNTSITFSFDDMAIGSTFDELDYDTSHITGVIIDTQPASGVLVDNGNRTLTYTPNIDYVGNDMQVVYTPTYDQEYAGITTTGQIAFNVYLYYNQDRPDLFIILGDSLLSQVFIKTEVFKDKFEECYGRELNVINKALGGATSVHLKNFFDEVMDAEIQEAYAAGQNIIAYYMIGTNNMKNSEANSSWDSDLDTMYDDIVAIKQLFATNYPNIDFILSDPQFLRSQGDVKEESVYWIADKEMTSEHYRKGSYAFWKGTDLAGTVVTDKKCINKVQVEINDPKYMLSNGCTLSQEYWHTRNDPLKSFVDELHPNWQTGYGIQHQGLLDGLFLHLEYGINPLPVVDFKWYPTVYINLSDAATIIDGYKDAGLGYEQRDINNWNINTTDTLVNAVYGDNTASPYTFQITGSTTIDDIPVQESESGWLWKTYREKALKVSAGSPITIEISGLTVGHLYKFQAIGSSGTIETANTSGVLKYPSMNKEVIRQCTVDHVSESNPRDNVSDYWDITMIPQATTDTLTLECEGTAAKTYISGIKFYKISEGE